MLAYVAIVHIYFDFFIVFLLKAMRGLEVERQNCSLYSGTGGGISGLVAQSVMSATDMLGRQDVCGLSAMYPCLTQWICVCTKPKDVGMPL